MQKSPTGKRILFFLQHSYASALLIIEARAYKGTTLISLFFDKSKTENYGNYDKSKTKEHKNRGAHNHEHPCSAYLQPALFAGFDSDVILC